MAVEAISTEDPPFIQYLMDPEQDYDCYFLVGDKEGEFNQPVRIGVVKKMLIAHSSVFRAELQDSEIKEKGDVHVTDLFPKTFKNLLRFVYGFDNMSSLCFDDADDLLYAADKYMLAGLKSKLATRLSQLLNTDNICTLMNNPACYNEFILNAAITNILQSETGRVLSTPLFLEITGDAFNRILQQDALNVKEIELWRAALRWAKHKTDDSEDGQVLRQTLTEQTKHIPLCTLNGEELSQEVIPTGVVNIEELQLICKSHKKQEKQEQLVTLCNEINPRKITSSPLYSCNILNKETKCNISSAVIYGEFFIITKTCTIELATLCFEGKSNCQGQSNFQLQSNFQGKSNCQGQSKFQLPSNFQGQSNFPNFQRQSYFQGQTNNNYKFNCYITVSKFPDYVTKTNEQSVFIECNKTVVYNKDVMIPIINNGKNVILYPNNKYRIHVQLDSQHKMYYWNNMPIINAGDFDIVLMPTYNSHNEIDYCLPMKELFYRIVIT